MPEIIEEVETGFVPNGIYTCLVTGANNAPSSSKQTPQSRVSFEIVAPAEVEFAGKQYKVGGAKFNITVWWSEKAIAGAAKFCRDLGLPKVSSSEEYQANLAKLEGKNYFVDIAVGSEPKYFLKTLTPAEVAAGKYANQADPVLDAKGEKIVIGYQTNASSRSVQTGTGRFADPDTHPW